MWPFSSPAPAQQEAAPPSACPVDHTTRDAWLKSNPSSAAPHSFPAQQNSADPHAKYLSTEREVSTIPRWLPASSTPSPSSSSSSAPPPPASSTSHGDAPPPACPMHADNVAAVEPNSAAAAAAVPKEENWVYPSPASFYTALQRKDRNPQAKDMGVVVPIHNAVNERVWQQVLAWEREAMGLKEGEETGSKLVSFVGRPQDVSPRARWKGLIGYTAPFDRHDWLVDRPVAPPSSPSSASSSPSSPSQEPESIRIRYVIDFYTGRGAGLLAPPPPSSSSSSGTGEDGKGVEANFMPNLAFFIDCRPALDGFEGVRMRFNRFWGLGGPEEKK
ncbi:hypothetical protein JCM8097_009108 [Rhodosporidiobolus ruineniae]